MTCFALFYQSLVSDWNHGNAHFLRGLMRALPARGHSTICYEQADNWSLSNLLSVNPRAVAQFREAFPDLAFEAYQRDDAERFLRQRLAHADVAIVNEWNEPDVVRLIGRLCRELGVTALFHDTHYRVVLDADYRGRLSPSMAERYRALGFVNVSVLHEAPACPIVTLTGFGRPPRPNSWQNVQVLRSSCAAAWGTYRKIF
jgi:DNA-binding transcriptional LysR family regulator